MEGDKQTALLSLRVADPTYQSKKKRTDYRALARRSTHTRANSNNNSLANEKIMPEKIKHSSY